MYLYEEDMAGINGYIQGCQGVAGETIGALGKVPPTAKQSARVKAMMAAQKPSQADAFRAAKAKLAAAAKGVPPGAAVSAAARSKVATTKAEAIAAMMSQAKNPEAAETAMLLQKIVAIKAKAKAAKKITKAIAEKVKKARKGDKAAAAELKGLGWWNPYTAATDALAKHIVGPMLEYTGYMAPDETTIKNAQASVDQLKENIARREAEGNPASDIAKAAVKPAEAAVKDLREARDKVLNLPSGKEYLAAIKAFLKKAKWFAIIGGVGLAGFIAWPYISALRAPGRGLKAAGEAIGKKLSGGAA